MLQSDTAAWNAKIAACTPDWNNRGAYWSNGDAGCRQTYQEPKLSDYANQNQGSARYSDAHRAWQNNMNTCVPQWVSQANPWVSYYSALATYNNQMAAWQNSQNQYQQAVANYNHAMAAWNAAYTKYQQDLAACNTAMASYTAIVAQNTPATYSTYGYDGVGNIVSISDDGNANLNRTLGYDGLDGTIVWRNFYHPYGERMLGDGGNTNKQWFGGKTYEDATGLSYFGTRWYDPVIGRFMAMDPVDWNVSNPTLSFNTYIYANNNPLRYTDPDGRTGVAVSAGDADAAAAVGRFTGTGGFFASQGWLALPVFAGYEMGKYSLTYSQGDKTAGAPVSASAPKTDNGQSDSGDKDPSTPTGHRGHPLEVSPGTHQPANIGGTDYSGHALDRMQ